MGPSEIVVEVVLCTAVVFILFLICRRLNIFRKGNDQVAASDYIGMSLLVSALIYAAKMIVLVGIQSHGNRMICNVGVRLSAGLYGFCKLILHSYFVETVHHTVSLFNDTKKRLRSVRYLINMFCLIPYICVHTIIVIVVKYHVDSNDRCHFGAPFTIIGPLAAYEIFLYVVMVSQFMWPLLHFSNESKTIRKVAIKNLIGVIMCLLTQFAIVGMNTMMHGNQLAYVTYLMMTLDLCVNAIVISWLLCPKRTVDKEVAEVIMTVTLDSAVRVIIDDSCSTSPKPTKCVPVTTDKNESPVSTLRSSPDSTIMGHSPELRLMQPYYIHRQASPSRGSGIASLLPIHRECTPETTASSETVASSRSGDSKIAYDQWHSSIQQCNGRRNTPSPVPTCKSNLNGSGDGGIAPTFDQWQSPMHPHRNRRGTPPLAPTSRNISSALNTKCSGCTGEMPTFEQWQTTIQPANSGCHDSNPISPVRRHSATGTVSGVVPSFDQWQNTILPHRNRRGTPPLAPPSKNNASMLANGNGSGDRGMVPTFDQWQTTIQPANSGCRDSNPVSPVRRHSGTGSGSGVVPSFDQWQNTILPHRNRRGTPPLAPPSKNNASMLANGNGSGDRGMVPTFDQWQTTIQPANSGCRDSNPVSPVRRHSGTGSGSGVVPSFDQWQNTILPHRNRRGTPPLAPPSKNNASMLANGNGSGDRGMVPTFDQWQTTIQPANSGCRDSNPVSPVRRHSGTGSGSGVVPSFDQWQNTILPHRNRRGTPPLAPPSKNNASMLANGNGSGDRGMVPTFDQWQTTIQPPNSEIRSAPVRKHNVSSALEECGSDNSAGFPLDESESSNQSHQHSGRRGTPSKTLSSKSDVAVLANGNG